jgi:hypothetical protein
MTAQEELEDRQIRAGRNQAMFRTVNEHVRELNQAFHTFAQMYSIVCECADAGCLARLEIKEDEYQRVRRHPTWFVVLSDHIDPAIEVAVEKHERYAIVEKVGRAADVSEATA